MSTLALYETGI